MTFKSIGPAETRHIREIALKALEQAFAEHNISVTPDRGSFDATFCSLKFQFAIKGENGVVETREALDFKRFCGMFNLKPEHLGSTFVNGGIEYRVTGLKPSSPRFPVLAARVRDGKTFKFPADSVTRKLNPATAGGL